MAEQSQPELDPQPSVALDRAELGDVLQDVDDRPVPDGWHVCDGSRQLSFEWPAFVAALRIKGGSFVLPIPQRVLPGYRWIIKLGAKRPLPPPPPPSPRPRKPPVPPRPPLAAI